MVKCFTNGPDTKSIPGGKKRVRTTQLGGPAKMRWKDVMESPHQGGAGLWIWGSRTETLARGQWVRQATVTTASRVVLAEDEGERSRHCERLQASDRLGQVRSDSQVAAAPRRRHRPSRAPWRRGGRRPQRLPAAVRPRQAQASHGRHPGSLVQIHSSRPQKRVTSSKNKN